jgi:hypothetical protein
MSWMLSVGPAIAAFVDQYREREKGIHPLGLLVEVERRGTITGERLKEEEDLKGERFSSLEGWVPEVAPLQIVYP